MCSVELALIGASTAMTAAGQHQQGQAAKKAGEYQAQAHATNAALGEQRARDALMRGAVEERKHRRQTAQLIGQQTAAQAANGLDVSFGSTLNVALDTAMLGELDALTIRENAKREARGEKLGAHDQRRQAALRSAGARNAATAGNVRAAGSILSGAADAVDPYAAYKRNTALTN